MHARRALLLAGGCCSSLLMLPATANAQSIPQATDSQDQQATPPAAPAPGEPNASKNNESAIVVTGIRRSVQDSIAIKRRNTSMVEAVSAEEIGKLPDVSIADSIARLPGLTAQRLGSVVGYKTPDADISGMGLAGTVDLRTIRPLAYGKTAVALNIRGELDEGGGRNAEMSNKGWRGSASYIGQNKDGTLGWLIGFAHLDAPSHIDHAQDWYYENYGAGSPACTDSSDCNTNILAGQEAFAYTSRDIRDGITGTVEWKPTSGVVHSVLDVYYSRFKQRTVMHGAEWFSDYNIANNTTFSDLQNVSRYGSTYAESGHVDGVDLVLRNDDNRRTDHLFSIGLNNDFRLAEHTHLFADLSYSSNKRDETYIETYAGYGSEPVDTRPHDSYNFSDPAMGMQQFSDFGFVFFVVFLVLLGDRVSWVVWGHDGLMNSPHVKETLGSGDLTLKQDIGGSFLSSIELGADFTHRHKTKTVDEHNLMLKNDRAKVAVDPRFVNDPTSLDIAGNLVVF